MNIVNHRLEGEGISYSESPNHSGPFGENLPDTIIIHYTADRSPESAIRTLCNPRVKASAHLVIGRDESITQLVPFNTIAWHAGKSSYVGRSGYNKYSIGIEIDNAGRLTKRGNEYFSWFGKAYPENEVIEAVHRNENRPSFWHTFKEEQISIVQDICLILTDTYPITSILGHEDVSPNRKSDPGPAFPLEKLRARALYSDRDNDGDEFFEEKNLGIVTASKLNIRSKPVYTASTVAPPLSEGTIVDILQEKNGWYEVNVETQGWVKKDWIKT